MAVNLKNRNFLTLKDFTPEEIEYLLDLAADVKDKKKKGIPVKQYQGSNIALVFEKQVHVHAVHLKWQRMTLG